MEGKEASLSILMFPWVAHGHVFPYLELAKHLSNHNFTIYFCSTPLILNSIPQYPFIRPVELHLPSSPDLPPHLHSTKHAPPHLMPLLLNAFQASKSAFKSIITSLSPNLLIYDAFQPWSATIAASLHIPAVHFATTGAAPYALFYHLFTNRDSPFPYQAIHLRPYEWNKLQSLTASDRFKNEDQDDGFGHFSRSRDVVLMKTSRGIEGKYMDYLSLLCNKKIVCTGPLITTSTTTSDDDHSHIIEWLNQKDRFSTVFISFGSENYLSKNEMQEMAKGLEASNANFIWVVRSPKGERADIPKGFMERIGERGKIVEGWAPQAKILGHSSIMGFVSHCGMSSTIESVYFGVPVIGIPMKMDQPLNARLVVEAGVGVEVERDENGGFGGDEVAAAIHRVRERGEEMRSRAAQIIQVMKKEEEYAPADVADQLRQICLATW